MYLHTYGWLNSKLTASEVSSAWVAHSFRTAVKRLSEPKKCHQDCLMSSAQSFYGPCLQSVAHSLNCNFSGNVPLLHTSKYITEHDQFYQAFPCVSTASDKHWGEKAWVRGYSAYSSSFTSQQSNVTKWRGLDGLVPQWWSALLSTCTLHQLAYLVLAMSTGMDAIVVTRPLIMLAAKWQMMLSLK